MTRRKRRQIFYLLVALFLIIGTAIVLYAEGWRLDIETWHASKVGGIFVRSFPDDAQITLDKKPIENKSTFLGRGTLISDLFPKTYRIELNESGYHVWHENASVLPSFVAEFKYAVLVPQNATTVAAGPVKNFLITQGTLITQNMNGSILSGKTLIGKGILVDESSDGSAAIIKNQADGNYSLHQFGNGIAINLTAILAKSGARANDVLNIFFDPHDPGKIIAGGPSKIWIIDIATMDATQIGRAATGKTLGGTIAAGSSLIAWTESKKSETSSTIVFYDPSSGEITASSTIPGKNSELKWIKDGAIGILQNDGELYIYDTNSQGVEKIADDVENFDSTKNGSLLAALERRSMEIIPLTGNSDNYYRFNLPDIMNARRAIWYKDGTHLFVEYDDHVSFLDLKDTGLNNFTTVTQGTAPSYDPDKNTLYLINPDSQLVRFDFPG